MTETVPAWKFWHPLSFWWVVGIFVVVNLAVTFLFVALREGAGVDVPQWIVSGVAGLTAWLLVIVMARRKRARA